MTLTCRILYLILSSLPDLNDCKNCTNGTWSKKGSDRCRARSETYLQWSNPHPIIMIIATAFGISLLLVIFIIFLVYRNSAPMKRAEVRLSCVMMAGQAISFGSVICFMGKPDVHLCRARQVMYGMGFTLCVSCILVKAYRTFLAFLPFGQITNRRLHKLYKPPAIVIVITALQGIICILWVAFDSPDIGNTTKSMEIIIHCIEGDRYIGVGIMLSYIALLAFVGFLLAFKGRRVPQEFSETGYIIFSMLTYLFVWVCFIPIYITNQEQGTAVQASAILVSNYGIIFCHFLPKCYEALWGSNTDTLERILRRCRVTSSPNNDSEVATDTGVVIPKNNAHLQTRFSTSRLSTIQGSSGSISMFSPTDSDVGIMPMYNGNVYKFSNRLEIEVIRRRRSNSRNLSF